MLTRTSENKIQLINSYLVEDAFTEYSIFLCTDYYPFVFPEFPLLVQCYAEIVKSEKTQSAMNSMSVNLIYCIIMIKIFGRWTPGIFDERRVVVDGLIGLCVCVPREILISDTKRCQSPHRTATSSL